MKQLALVILFLVFGALANAQNARPSVNIVFDGDSQTQWGIHPAKLVALLVSAGFTNIRSINYALNGQNTYQMVKDVSSQIVPRYNSNYNENIVLYFIGYNDTYNGASTNTVKLHDDLAAYYNTLKKAGFKVIMINLPDGENRTGIAAINKMYALENKSISDAFVNCRENGGVFENYVGNYYYRDNVHLSEAGCNYLAEHYVYSKFVALMNEIVQPTPVNNLLNGLEEYYKLDETSGFAIDEVGSNNGIVSAGVNRGSAGKINGAYAFDGNNDYVSLTSAINQITGSYSFWIKINAITDDLLILGNNPYYSRIFIGINGGLKMETNTNGEEFAFYTAFPPAIWYNVLLTREGNTVNFYRNGIFIGSSTISNANNLSLSQIGCNGRSFRGTIDEVGIWSRALKQAEITAIYNNGNGLSYPFGTGTNNAVTGVSISPVNASISVKSTTSLAATVVPANATNKTVSWSSGNAAVATVNSTGIVTGVAAGITDITARAQEGNKTATCRITVTNTNTATLLTGLSVYYKFDEASGIAKDETGSNNGAVSAGVTRGASGIINGAYIFDSRSDYISLPSVINQKTGSYAFWIKITAITDDLLILGSNPYYSRIFIGINGGIKMETNTNGEEYAFYTRFSTALWYYVVLTREGNTVNFYRNGIFIGSSTISGANNLSLSQIGCNGRSFNGTMDELGIWNRILTATEVTALYNNGKGLAYPFTSLKSAEGNDNSSDHFDLDSTKILSSESYFYPNPAYNRIFTRRANSAQTRVCIYDLHGKQVINRQMEENTLDISGLAKGLYIIKLINNENVIVDKLMKE